MSSGRNKQRLDKELVSRGVSDTRSHAEQLIRMGGVSVNKKIMTKPGTWVGEHDKIRRVIKDEYVSRAAYKLKSAAEKLDINFRGKTVLDIGSSTGGFTDYVLQHGAKKVIAVDVGTEQLHPKLRGLETVELFEKTDIRTFGRDLSDIDIAVADLSFISLRGVLPGVLKKLTKGSLVLAMVKPQFESGPALKHKGVIKNDKIRRQILKEFEEWAKSRAVVMAKADSEITGAKGNRERFYLLKSQN